MSRKAATSSCTTSTMLMNKKKTQQAILYWQSCQTAHFLIFFKVTSVDIHILILYITYWKITDVKSYLVG